MTLKGYEKYRYELVFNPHVDAIQGEVSHQTEGLDEEENNDTWSVLIKDFEDINETCRNTVHMYLEEEYEWTQMPRLRFPKFI
jgi:hypothetical protein